MVYYTIMQERRVTSFRLPVELLDWLDAYAREASAWQDHEAKPGGTHRGKDSGKTAVVERLLQALREGRLHEAPPSRASPFPLEERAAGLTADFPILICLEPH